MCFHSTYRKNLKKKNSNKDYKFKKYKYYNKSYYGLAMAIQQYINSEYGIKADLMFIKLLIGRNDMLQCRQYLQYPIRMTSTQINNRIYTFIGNINCIDFCYVIMNCIYEKFPFDVSTKRDKTRWNTSKAKTKIKTFDINYKQTLPIFG